MASSGGASLLFGRLFDRYGFRVIVWLAALTWLYAPLVWLGGFPAALAGAVLWGVGMGVHESVIPAAVARPSCIRSGAPSPSACSRPAMASAGFWAA